MAYGPTTDGADVTVTTGTGFSVDASVPGAVTTSTTASTTTASASQKPPTTTSTTTTAPAGTSDNATGFDPPSSADEPLSPWDPRSCTPSGGPGS